MANPVSSVRANEGTGMRPRVVTIAIAVLALSSCGGSSRAASAKRTTVVAFVGDSNLLLGTRALALTFFDRKDSYPFVVISRVGSGIRYSSCAGESEPCATHDYWRARLDDVHRKVRPDAYVVNLGVNDTNELGTATTPGYADYGEKVDYLMARFGDRPVFWTNLPCKIEPKSRLVGCNAVNDALAAASSRHRNLIVIDWATVANPHPTWMSSSNGGIHYAPVGYGAWSDLVAKSIEARLGQKT